MALTQRSDGTGTINLVDATWWNEYYELLTGVMTDQPVTIANQVMANGLLAKVLATNNDDSLRLYDRTGVLGTSLGWSQNGGGIYAYDASGGGYIFQGGTKNGFTINGILKFGVYDNGTGTVRQVRVFIGATDPSTYTTVNEGDIWIKG